MAEAKPLVLIEGGVFHGRYEVVKCLRAGGMGAVYEVLDRKTRRRRALKVMLPSAVTDADLRARFKLEATVTAEIESEHLVETVDADVDAETGAPFVVMELLKGEDLGQVLARRGALPPSEAVALLRQAALALDRTHAASIVHRDLKPENLFVTTGDDGSARLKVLDFGIAKIAAELGAPLPTTRAMGTPLYMPPEQIRGDGGIGPRADLYALAHVAYALLTGEPYWKEESAAAPALYALFTRVLAGPTEPPTARARRRAAVALPPAFDAWFARAAALDPGGRFAGASPLVAALAEALALSLDLAAPPLELTAAPVVSASLDAYAPRRSTLPRLGLAALLAAVAAALMLALGGRSPTSAAAAGPSVIAAAPSPPLAAAPTSAATTTAPSLPSAPASNAALAPSASPRPARSPLPAKPRPVASSQSGAYDPTDVR
jgi:eukaryotic-like serine/threonine-protein kinase